MKINTKDRIAARMFAGDEDFWRIRQLPIDTFAITPIGWNWDFRRWDGSRFYEENPVIDPKWYENIRLWESTDGQLAGLVNSYEEGWFSLQLDPHFRHLIEKEMVVWAEENLGSQDPNGEKQQILTEVYDYDLRRIRLLEERGYEQQPNGGVIRLMRMGLQPLPDVQVADGYTMREIRAGDRAECQKLADLLNAAFNRTFHYAGEFYDFARNAPSFRPELHLVMEAADGSFAAHVAAIYDDENRYGFYEPVCTHPDHRRKNLAQSLMFELLHRLDALGAKYVSVETGGMMPANKLYDSIGFSEIYFSHVWRKTLEG